MRFALAMLCYSGCVGLAAGEDKCREGMALCDGIGAQCGDNSCCTGMGATCGAGSVCTGMNTVCGASSECPGMMSRCGPGSRCNGLGAQCVATAASQAPTAAPLAEQPSSPAALPPLTPLPPMSPMTPLPPMPPMTPMAPMKMPSPQEVRSDGCDVGPVCEGRSGAADCGVAICCPANCTTGCSVSCSQQGAKLHASCACSETLLVVRALPDAVPIAALALMVLVTVAALTQRHRKRSVNPPEHLLG